MSFTFAFQDADGIFKQKKLIKVFIVGHAHLNGMNLKSFLMRVELLSLKEFDKSHII